MSWKILFVLFLGIPIAIIYQYSAHCAEGGSKSVWGIMRFIGPWKVDE
jgi:hypothetical protein